MIFTTNVEQGAITGVWLARTNDDAVLRRGIAGW